MNRDVRYEMEDGMAHLETFVGSDEALEGLTTFTEKRTPEFGSFR